MRGRESRTQTTTTNTKRKKGPCRHHGFLCADGRWPLAVAPLIFFSVRVLCMRPHRRGGEAIDEGGGSREGTECARVCVWACGSVSGREPR